MRIRTLLIDGSHLLKRSYDSFKNTYTAFGSLSGVYGFNTIMRKYITEYQINKCIVFWDGEEGGFGRYLLDNKYKANRKSKSWHTRIEMTDAQIRAENEKNESILKNRIRIKNYIENLFIRQIEVFQIEADDLIAQYILEHNNKEMLYLATNDRDYSQLLDNNLTIIFSNIPKPINKLNYSLYFKPHYTNALTMKIICGDDSDNIDGIKGIEEATLLKHFPELKFKTLSVKDICKMADSLNKERMANKKKPLKCFENLLNNIDRLKLNYKLMNLKEPMLNEEAIEELKQLELPLSPEDRGSKNLYKMMIEDEFLTIYKSTFAEYVKPFYTVIMNEKRLLDEYNQNSSKEII